MVIVGTLIISKVILSTEVSSPSNIPNEGLYISPRIIAVPETVKIYSPSEIASALIGKVHFFWSPVGVKF